MFISYLLIALISATNAKAQETPEEAEFKQRLDSEVEAFRKATADKLKEEAETKKKNDDLEWSAYDRLHPRVIGIGLTNTTNESGLALVGPYIGYVFSPYFELGIVSRQSYSYTDLQSQNSTSEALSTSSSFFIGTQLTASIPIAREFKLFSFLTPGYARIATRTSTVATGQTTAHSELLVNPAFGLDVAPIGVALKWGRLETRLYARLVLVKGGSKATNGPTETKGHYTQFTTNYGLGNIEFRYRY